MKLLAFGFIALLLSVTSSFSIAADNGLISVDLVSLKRFALAAALKSNPEIESNDLSLKEETLSLHCVEIANNPNNKTQCSGRLSFRIKSSYESSSSLMANGMCQEKYNENFIYVDVDSTGAINASTPRLVKGTITKTCENK